MSVFSAFRFFGFSSTISTSSTITGFNPTPSSFFLPQETDGPVFNKEYDSMVRTCEVLIHFEKGNREHVGYTRSSWAIIFDFGGRNIKYELVDRTNGLIGPIWMDLGRNSSILYKSIKVGKIQTSPRLINELVRTQSDKGGEQWHELNFQNFQEVENKRFIWFMDLLKVLDQSLYEEAMAKDFKSTVPNPSPMKHLSSMSCATNIQKESRGLKRKFCDFP